MNRSRTILYLETGVSGGGSFECLYQHLNLLDRDRYRPIVVFVSKTDYLRKLEDEVPVHVLDDPVFSPHVSGFIRMPTRAIWWAARKLVPRSFRTFVKFFQGSSIDTLTRIIDENDVDLVHLNNRPDRNFIGIEAARRTNTPCLSHVRSIDIRNFSRMGAAFCNRYVDEYVAISEYVARTWTDQGLDGDRMNVVHDFVREEPVPSVDLTEQFDLPPDAFTLITAARPTREKGLGFLLESYASHRDRHLQADVRLILLGADTNQERTHSLLRRHGLEDSVTTTDWVPDARPFLKAADGVVVPSRVEGLGRVVLESFMVETPVIATNVGGISEVIDGSNGILVEYGNQRKLSEAIERLRTDPQGRASLVESGQRTLREKFSPETYRNKMETIYDRLLSSQPDNED